MLDHAHITDSSFDKAAEGLLINAQKLIAAGYFQEAKMALEHFLQAGPWALKKHGQVVQQMEGLMPLVCFLCGTASPKVGSLGAMTAVVVKAWAADETASYIDMLKMPVRNQLGAAGVGWSQKMLVDLVAMPDDEARWRAFSKFCIDAEFVLKARLSSAEKSLTPANITKPEHTSAWLQSLLQGKVPADFDALDGLGIGEMLSMVSPIVVDDAAALVSNKQLCETILRVHTKSRALLDYQSLQLLTMLLNLCLAEGDTDTAIQVATALATSNSGLATLMTGATCPNVVKLLQRKVCAAVLDIDDNAVIKYLLAIATRAPQPAVKKMTLQPLFMDTFMEFTNHLKGSLLAEKKFVTLSICDTDEQAYAIACKPAEAKALWDAAVALVPQTKRWPVVTTCWSGKGNTAEALQDEDLFSRFYFEEESAKDDVSPAAFIAASKKVKLDAALIKAEKALFEDDDADDLADAIEYELEASPNIKGLKKPTAKDVAAARIDGKPIKNRYQLERWLLDWEVANKASVAPQEVLPGFFEPDQTFLIFLPTPNSWEAFAYLSFYGRDRLSSECCIALAKRWHEQYGAQLYAHFGTMVEYYTSSAPTTIDAAWQLAKEHDLMASCTLAGPGISVRHYAQGLMHTNAWFLHERP
jgi:hypothetical protein